MKMKVKVGIFVMALIVLPHCAICQGIFDRFFATYSNSDKIAAESEDNVKFVSGAKVKRSHRLPSAAFGGGLAGTLLQHPLAYGKGGYVFPNWLAAARLTAEGEAEITGLVTFQPLPYNNEVKVTINTTGLPPGRHALHIHTYGDIMGGCVNTGGQFPNNFLGNVETKEDGTLSKAFVSIYINMFGFNGIIGRAFVIHANPIDMNTAFDADVFSTSLKGVPYALAYQNEEGAVGAPLACGVISIMSSNIANPTVMPPK